MCVRTGCPIADHGASQPETSSMFDARLGSSDVLREGGHSLPPNVNLWTCATATPATSFLSRPEVFERCKLVDGRHLRRAHATESQQ